MKTIAYENSEDSYLDDVLMVGAYLGFAGDLCWGGNFKDEIINGGTAPPYSTVGIPDDEYNINTLYDRDWQIYGWPEPHENSGGWPASLLIDDINNNVHIINFCGHSQYNRNMKLYPDDVKSLTNEKYCFIYSQGCMAGGFDNPLGYDCVAENITVETSHGAFAGIWNARFGFEGGFDEFYLDGPSQRYDRWFFDAIYNASKNSSVMRELGGANQYSKEKNLVYLDETGVPGWDIDIPRTMRWVYYELNLFGDPEIAIKSDHDLEVTSIDLPKYVPPGDSKPVKAYIWNRGLNDETDVTVNFFVNGQPEDSEIIENIPYCEARDVTFTYNFSHGIGYDISVEVDIVDGEDITSNNCLIWRVKGDTPPNKPETPESDVNEVKKNKQVHFSTSTTDPDNGDQVYYWWDWNDGTNSGWIGPNLSGQTIYESNSWDTNGQYAVRVISKDNEIGALSPWSDPNTIKVPFIYIGNANEGSNFQSVENQISGTNFVMSYNANADYMGVYIQTDPETSPLTKCMIYRADTCSLVGNATEEKTIVDGEEGAWITYNFSDPKPGLQKGTEYTLVCWSSESCNLAYNSSSNESGRSKSQTFGLAPNNINWDENQTRTYSIYCSYSTTPEIKNVTISPNPIGFGYNTTISADIENYVVPLDTANVSIMYPDNRTKNFTMTTTDNHTYQFVFNESWISGLYECSIWVSDAFGANCSSQNHTFNVSVNASMSIATLQNSYSGSQYINVTDPPNPPENYTLVDRGLTWNTYYNASSGENILETYQEPINYQLEDGTWIPINNTLSPLAEEHPAFVYGYRTGNDQGLYGVYFKSNTQQEWPVAFTYNKSDDPAIHTVRSKLVGVGYIDPQSDWAYEYLQSVQSSQGQTNNNSITYPGVFTGTDVTWSYGNTGLKEEIMLSNTTKTVLQSHPPSQYDLNDASSYLVFITKLDYQNLNLYNGSEMLNENVTISDTGVEFRDLLGRFKCALPLGEAYEVNNESSRQKLTYRIVHLNGNTYLLSGLKLADLNEMTFPVVIDPTLSIDALTNDGYLYNSNSNYNAAWAASNGTISSSAVYLSIGQSRVASFPPDYRIYRSFLLFNTSQIPTNAIIDDAKLSLYKKDDYSTTDFTITIQNGQPTYPHNPLQAGDYAKDHYSGNGGSLNTVNFVNGWNDITLTNISWINNTGVTKLCLRSNRDIFGMAPIGNEYVTIYSADDERGGNFPMLKITYRNQSKIKNAGSTDIQGYLLIQVHYYDSHHEEWVVDSDVINETSPRTISSGNQLALDTIFNGLLRVSDLTFGTGTYRVYTAFRDPEGNILRTNDAVDLEAWWEFSKT
jgi:hypothetical protein